MAELVTGAEFILLFNKGELLVVYVEEFVEPSFIIKSAFALADKKAPIANAKIEIFVHFILLFSPSGDLKTLFLLSNNLYIQTRQYLNEFFFHTVMILTVCSS